MWEWLSRLVRRVGKSCLGVKRNGDPSQWYTLRFFLMRAGMFIRLFEVSERLRTVGERCTIFDEMTRQCE